MKLKFTNTFKDEKYNSTFVFIPTFGIMNSKMKLIYFITWFSFMIDLTVNKKTNT